MSDGVPNFGVAKEFPELWRLARDRDYWERFGGSGDRLMAEADLALRELWLGRSAAAYDRVRCGDQSLLVVDEGHLYEARRLRIQHDNRFYGPMKGTRCGCEVCVWAQRYLDVVKAVRDFEASRLYGEVGLTEDERDFTRRGSTS